jgi:hypothetical protein
VTVRHEAFDELLDRAALAEEEGEATGQGDLRRRQFALEVDRAVKKALAREDDRAWHTQTMKRFKCRLYFFRHCERLFLVACARLQPEEVVMA